MIDRPLAHPDPPFAVGASIVRRDFWFGRLLGAWPARVLQDDGVTTTTVLWPGVEGFAPATWVAWLQSGDLAARARTLTDLAARSWHVAPWTWQTNIYLRQVVAGRWFSVTACFNAADHRFKGWYVDLESPPLRRSFGFDVRDLFLDLVVNVNGSFHWKDEDEYAQAVELGLLSTADCAGVAAAREEILALARSRQLLRGGWENWRLDPSWRVPTLPAEVLADAANASAEQ